MPVTLRVATTADLPEIKKLQPKNWGDIIPNIRFYLGSEFCYTIVAEQEQTIMGCGTAIQHDNCIWLANIIVGEEYRGLGLGGMITAHLLDYSKQRTDSIILIATNLGYPIYKKQGFIDEEEYLFFDRQHADVTLSDNIIPYEATFKDSVLQLDYEVTGELRPKLLLPKLPEAFVYLQNNEFQGFAIPSLGEGLVLAKTTEAGLALMASNTKLQNRFALPKTNHFAIEHALHLGYQSIPDIYAIKMYWGKHIKWRPTMQYGRAGGNMG